MQQRRMIRSANEFDQVISRVHVHSQRIPQIGIKIRQPRAVDDEIKILLQPCRDLRLQPQPRLRNIALHDFHSLREIRA